MDCPITVSLSLISISEDTQKYSRSDPEGVVIPETYDSTS